MKLSLAFFAKNLKNWRQSLELSQTEFADKFSALDASKAKRAVISSYENLEATPQILFILEVSEKMGVTLDGLFGSELSFPISKAMDILEEPLDETVAYKKTEGRGMEQMASTMDRLSMMLADCMEENKRLRGEK